MELDGFGCAALPANMQSQPLWFRALDDGDIPDQQAEHALAVMRCGGWSGPKSREVSGQLQDLPFLFGRDALARANAGAPGTDGMTFAAIEASGLDSWLAGLREELISKTYRPDPVRRVTIPKPDGSQSHRTALLCHQPLGSAEITHPFHPLRGQRFVVLKVRRVAGVETLSLRHHDLGSFAMAREWTDWAPPGAPAVSAGKSLMIDAFGLLSLTELVTSLTRNGGLDR
jgi:hypothetical protein